MQIRNDFNTFSGREYHNSHTHHITKCLHEEEHKKHETGALGTRNDTSDADTGAGQKAQQDVVFAHGTGLGRQNVSMKKGLGMLKGIWDSMGDEEAEKSEEASAPGQKGFFHNPITAAVFAFQSAVSDRIVSKWEGTRDKIKVHIKSAFRRFGRDRESFGALSDPKGRFTKNGDAQDKYD
ncbi:MAG: hypothetical protein K2N55_12455, partial [Lachnospiraceae bacterium]|nr:hypothetical protein [Lachnospiraceae bacterium]